MKGRGIFGINSHSSNDVFALPRLKRLSWQQRSIPVCLCLDLAHFLVTSFSLFSAHVFCFLVSTTIHSNHSCYSMVFLTKSVNGLLKKVYPKLTIYSIGMQSKDRNKFKSRHFPEVTLRLSFLRRVVMKEMILDSRCLWMINVSVGLAAWQPQGFFFMVLIFFQIFFLC